jgi:bifunctional DNA-binding transcriptional regulator/antitoxin component of YhaV-PrlF toxin-antitoxin module
MRITSKGQVTIPIGIRRQAGLWPNTEVTLAFSRGSVILKKAAGRPARGRRVVEAIRGKATTRLSTDQIMALTRGLTRQPGCPRC